MKNAAKFLMGTGLSAGASYAWTLIPNSDTFAASQNPLAFIEHYHWGLVGMNIGKHVKQVKQYAPYLYGFGAGMVAVEAAGSQPFGWGKPPWEVVGNVALGGLLVLALLW